MAPLVVMAAVSAATAVYGAVEGQDQARRANREKEQAKKAVQTREAQLADEARAKAAAAKLAESAGSRAGTGASGGGASSFFSSGGVNFLTGFRNKASAFSSEDNIGRGALFGN